MGNELGLLDKNGVINLIDDKIEECQNHVNDYLYLWRENTSDVDSLLNSIKCFGSITSLENAKQFVIDHINKTNTNNSNEKSIQKLSDIFLIGNSDINNLSSMVELRHIVDNPYLESRDKCFYVIDFGNNITKIGVSFDIEKRIKTIETQSGRYVVKYGFTDCIENAYIIETFFKNMLKNKKINGEFYNIDFQYIVDTLNKKHSLELNIKYC